MRILHVLHSLDQRDGGPIRAVLELSARSLPLGLDSEVLGFGPLHVPDNPFPHQRIHALPVGFPRSYRYCPGLTSWARGNLGRFDGVILHGMWLYPNWAFPKACERAGLRYACFPHGMLEPSSFYSHGRLKALKKHCYWLLRERAVFKNASAVFFASERERKLAEGFVVPGQSFIVAPYGVDHATDVADRPLRSDLAIPADRRMALFLGRVHPIKNLSFLIQAWADANLGTTWILVIAGPSEPAYLRALEQLVRRNGIQSQVRFVGAVYGQDKSYLLGRASWFLLPSRHENFGISVLEAVNAGCPAVISDQVYLADCFPEGSEILPLDLGCWVDFLRNRLPDERHRWAQIENTRKWLIPKFAVDLVARHWATTICNVFAEAGES